MTTRHLAAEIIGPTTRSNQDDSFQDLPEIGVSVYKRNGSRRRAELKKVRVRKGYLIPRRSMAAPVSPRIEKRRRGRKMGPDLSLLLFFTIHRWKVC